MKKSLIPLIVCVVCFALGVLGVSAKQKSKKPAPLLYHATLRSQQLNSWPLDIAIEEVSTDEGIQELAQIYATGGERALEKAMDKLHKGYCDFGSDRMPIMVIRSRSEGVSRRIDILARLSNLSSLFQYLGGVSGYPYTHIQLEVDEHGIGRGKITPKMRLTFNAQGQMVLGTRSPEPFELTLVHAVN